MPVPTDTLWNIRRLNAVFAVVAVVLLGSTVWLVMADYTRGWRGHQREARSWQAALTQDAAARAVTAEQGREIQNIEGELARIAEELAGGTFEALGGRSIAEVEVELAEIERELNTLSLPTAVVKGELGPLTQQIERAVLDEGDSSPRVAELRAKLGKLQAQYDQKATRTAGLEAQRAALQAGLTAARAEVKRLEDEKTQLTRTRDALLEKLEELAPSGAAALGEVIRNAPLLDWFNPSEKPLQVVVPDVRTDLNFLTVETIDRCNTCHINIDNPAFEEGVLLRFVERQVASYQGVDTNRVERPAVMAGYWAEAARRLGPAGEAGLLEVAEAVRDTVNRERAAAELEPLADAAGVLAYLAPTAAPGSEEGGADAWGDSSGAVYFIDGVSGWLQESLGDEAYKSLVGLYRVALIDQYNAYRDADGLAALSTSSVILGHPRVELYVHPESAHPMTAVGCTSCHEGSGQETGFVHTAHTPGDLWVDAEHGGPVPAFLLEHTDDEGHGEHDSAGYTHDDVKLTDPHDPAPFAPVREAAAHELGYTDPSSPGEPRRAVRQQAYWEKVYGWHEVHYMEWEKPMHQAQFVQSSCNKCHTEIFDIQEEAPRLFEGRSLFAQLGCANCHAVEALEDDLDIKKVGPSLANVNKKLSASMTASWVWAPRAFRPTSKMPHYFMLENNSSPVDILRTRTEVTAITHYLRTAEPGAGVADYEPESAPEGAGNISSGKALFSKLGCMACHTNLAEDGEKWIVEDLQARERVDETEARSRYKAMSYNQQHVYVLEHLEHKLERTGPELSGVGTKLTEGRTQEEAQRWLYDWLRNPRHYSSYTIMPSFRLTEDEANDLTAYLLTLTRPEYKADAFGFDAEGKPVLDGASDSMLKELVASLKAAAGTLESARQEAETMSVDERLSFLGRKMVSHYGCSSCHQINGFEQATSPCAELNGWGLKDPHKLDFGYFDHAFDKQREKPIGLWKVSHEGLEADAPSVGVGSEKVHQVEVNWEHLSHDRRGWLYHKLHNPRVYDRGKTAYEGALAEGDAVAFGPEGSSIGRPYDKLKMPKFFLTDRQVRALTTYVTSIRKPLVSGAIRQAAMGEDRLRLARGRQLATRYNCYGCHNIEGNEPRVWEQFEVLYPDGGINYTNLNNAPPPLVGQGAKTQPEWLVYFLQDVHELRPWLEVRMPSFPMSGDEAADLAGYFAGWSRLWSGRLGGWLGKIEAFRKGRPDDGDWFTREAIGHELGHLRGFAEMAGLRRSRDFDPSLASVDERRAVWGGLVDELAFLKDLYAVDYPYDHTPKPRPDKEAFARGEMLFSELRCFQCHALGDEELLTSLWELDNAGSEAGGEFDDGGDGYDDEYDEYGDEDEGYGDDDDGYGEDEYGDEGGEVEAAPRGPTYTAPSLSLTADRLQWKWVDAWMQEPNTIQPGTKMPQWFAGGESAFKIYPAEVKGDMHAKYGYTGVEQRKYLMDFMYAAGRKNYTPGAERLGGIEKEAVELSVIEAPVVETPSDGGGVEAGPGGEGPSGPVAAGGDEPDAGGGDEPKPAEPVAAAVVREIENFHDDADASYDGQGKGRVIGRVNFAGKPPRRRPVRMGADAYCEKSHSGERVYNESLVVNDDGRVANAVVYVTKGLGGATFTPPTEPAVLDQVGCVYVPHVLAMQAGQPLKILNSDNTLHNVNCQPKINAGFNSGMPVKGMVLEKRFSKPEEQIPVKCDVHPWMGAFIFVVEHPFFAVTDSEGRFEITGLPPGDYTVEIMHEHPKVAAVTFEVTVGADRSHRVDTVVGDL